jgi:integrase
MTPTFTYGQLINDMLPDGSVSLGKIAPVGALEARKTQVGAVSFFWRIKIDGKNKRIKIGLYDSAAPPKSLQPTPKGYSIAAARRAAEDMAALHETNKPEGGYPALIEAEVQEKKQALAISTEANTHTLKALLNHYADHLEKLGRQSHNDVRSAFKCHVYQPWPTLANLPAKEVTGEQIADMMRKTMDAGKGRTANKLRSHIRAAFQNAKAARSKASIPLHFKAYEIVTNPALDTEPDQSQNKADKNPLTKEEMRAYWRAIKTLPGLQGGMLRLHLLTGSQRIVQLARLKSADINFAEDMLVLMDPKGRPGAGPRRHVVPLTSLASDALRACHPTGDYAFSTNGGKTRVNESTFSHWARDAATSAGIEPFDAKRLRSGVETLLASAGVSAEMRGRLQSHGIAGVQARHYDNHDYLIEKRNILDILLTQLELQPNNKVVNIGNRTRA